MGYYSRLRGGITIVPPIGYLELKNAGYDLSKNNDLALKEAYGDLFFALKNEAVDTMEGVLTRISTSRIEVYDGDEGSSYGLFKGIKKAVEDFGESHGFNGAVYVYGEEQGDIWRVRVVDNDVKEEHPTLMWPDGGTTKLER